MERADRDGCMQDASVDFYLQKCLPRIMILGIGLDLVHLPRIASLVARRGPEQFARRILSRKELADWEPESENSIRYLAVRFSVKEAAYKALYPATSITWKELSYFGFGSRFPGSKPFLLYEPIMSSRGDEIAQLHVSVSHDGEYVASTVIVETGIQYAQSQ